MVSKTQSIVPLETIYEEAASFTASSIDIPDQLSDSKRSHETTNGLISARSIPSVNSQRQRVYEKPPIEVRFRDGSKRFINPLTSLSMMINRRQLLDNPPKTLLSRQLLPSSKHRPLFHLNFDKKKFQSKLPLVINIITIEDLEQAGITPPASSSTDESDMSSTIPSEQNSSVKTLINIRQVPFKQPTVSQSLAPLSKPSLIIPTTLAVVPRIKPSVSTLQVTVTNQKNKKHLSFNSTFPRISGHLPIRSTQSSALKSVGSGLNSAFHPFRKPPRIPLQIPLIVDQRSSFYNSLSKQQQHLQNLSPFNRKSTAFSLSPRPKSITIDPRTSQAMSHPFDVSSRFYSNPQHFNITKHSTFDISQLSSKYLNLPLCITLPQGMSNHNQHLLYRQNNTLETRLLSAGLSPESIALYERIFDISKNRQINSLAPPMCSLTSVI